MWSCCLLSALWKRALGSFVCAWCKNWSACGDPIRLVPSRDQTHCRIVDEEQCCSRPQLFCGLSHLNTWAQQWFSDFQLIAQKQIWFWVDSTVCYLKMASFFFFFDKTYVKVLAAGMRGANWTEMRNVRRALVLLVTVSRHKHQFGCSIHSQVS